MPSITYSSTRGCETQKNLSFREVVMSGLAHDRGLFVPDSVPTVTMEELESWRSLSYADLAVEVMSKFVHDDEVPRKKLEDIVRRSCASFRHKDVTPVVEKGGHYILVSTVMYIVRVFVCMHVCVCVDVHVCYILLISCLSFILCGKTYSFTDSLTHYIMVSTFVILFLGTFPRTNICI